MYKILIIEDDGTIAEGLKKHLEKWDYQVECVTDFKNVMDTFLKFEPQLVLFISSANESMNIVMAMNMGGDEFIEKPFDLNVVTAKVQAVLRRTYEFQGSVDVMQWHGAYLNLADATIEYEQNKMELTKNEFRLFQMLLEHAGKIVSRDALITRLWESDEFIDDNTLTVNMTRLRKKLEQIGLKEVIQTKKGIGYMVAK